MVAVDHRIFGLTVLDGLVGRVDDQVGGSARSRSTSRPPGERWQRVVKALALGAKTAMVGRDLPCGEGAVNGQVGVENVLDVRGWASIATLLGRGKPSIAEARTHRPGDPCELQSTADHVNLGLGAFHLASRPYKAQRVNSVSDEVQWPTPRSAGHPILHTCVAPRLWRAPRRTRSSLARPRRPGSTWHYWRSPRRPPTTQRGV